MQSYSLDKCKGGGGVCDSIKRGLDHRGRGGGVVDLKCRRVCRIFVKKRRSGRIVAKEIYGGRGGVDKISSGR